MPVDRHGISYSKVTRMVMPGDPVRKDHGLIPSLREQVPSVRDEIVAEILGRRDARNALAKRQLEIYEAHRGRISLSEATRMAMKESPRIAAACDSPIADTTYIARRRVQ